MLDFAWGNFLLDETNNFIPGTWRELHGAERVLSIIRSSGTRGVKILADTFEGKVMELTGHLKFDNAEDMVLGVQEFITNMLRQGQPLIITNHRGEFVYDGCYVTNSEDIFATRKYDFQSHIEVRLVFLSPKGFARSTTRTDDIITNITSLPYSSSITIGGDTNPEPVIEFSLLDASTIESLFFINTTTGMQISVEDITFVDGDMLVIDIETKEVRLNTTPISFEGVFPDFIPGKNYYQLSAAGSAGLIIDQPAYNDDEVLYGTKKIGWKFTAPSSSPLSLVSLLIKSVSTSVESLYDDFSGASINGSLFSTSGGGPGELYQSGGELHLKADNGEGPLEVTQNANLSSAGDGVRFQIGVQQGGNTGNPDAGYGEWTDGTDYIRVRSSLDSTNQFNSIVSTAYYGSLNVPISGNGELKIIQVGADIEVYWQGVLKTTIPSVTLKANSKVKYRVAGTTGSNYITSTYIYRIINTNQNGDITFNIETDSAGDPSGTPITNGSITIPASEVSSSFSEILKSFATEPSIISTTVYHVNLEQSGGDINNYYVFKKQNTDTYASANLETYDGAAWTQVTGEDLYIKIWGSAPTGYVIDLVIRYFKSYFNVG